MTVAELRKVLDTLPDNTEVKIGQSDADGSWYEHNVTVYTVREAYVSVNHPERNKPAVIAVG